jgi:hypothetical protein
MAQANRPFLIVENSAIPAVDDTAGVQALRHRSVVLCHQAHVELIARLAATKPHRIVGSAADTHDIAVRGEHLGEVHPDGRHQS